MRYLIIGDVHAAFGSADKVIQRAIKEHAPVDQIIQVGDMGFAFPNCRPWQTDHGCHQVWIDGNHDNHEMLALRDKPNFGTDPYHSSGWAKFLELWEYKPRGSFENGILYIGGAASIDRQWRTEGVDWWPGENISYEQEEQIMDTIQRVGSEAIHTVISHDAPTGFSMLPALQAVQGPNAREFGDNNRKFLEYVRQQVMPDHWFFGHYHSRWEGETDGCKWRCIDMVRGGNIENEDYAILEIP